MTSPETPAGSTLAPTPGSALDRVTAERDHALARCDEYQDRIGKLRQQLAEADKPRLELEALKAQYWELQERIAILEANATAPNAKGKRTTGSPGGVA